MTSPNVRTFTDESFAAEALASPLPVLVDFTAPWCCPCKVPAPIVERLAAAMNRLSALPEWAARREATWSQWTQLSPAQLAERVRHEADAWAALVKKTGVYAD